MSASSIQKLVGPPTGTHARRTKSYCTDKSHTGFLTSKKGDVSMLGVVRTACHPTDLLSQSLQGVRLGSKVKAGSKQCGAVKPNNRLNRIFDGKRWLPGRRKRSKRRSVLTIWKDHTKINSFTLRSSPEITQTVVGATIYLWSSNNL